VIGRFPGETSCLTLVWAVLDLYITHATNGIKFTQLERQRLKNIRYDESCVEGLALRAEGLRQVTGFCESLSVRPAPGSSRELPVQYPEECFLPARRVREHGNESSTRLLFTQLRVGLSMLALSRRSP
jgi:hypothetical protein